MVRRLPKDRLTHHAKAVLTAVEVATSESDKLIEGFRNFMTESRKTVKGEYKSSKVALEQMEVLLKRNKIEFAYADASQKRRV
jgi:hypothetical protein